MKKKIGGKFNRKAIENEKSKTKDSEINTKNLQNNKILKKHNIKKHNNKNINIKNNNKHEPPKKKNIKETVPLNSSLQKIHPFLNNSILKNNIKSNII